MVLGRLAATTRLVDLSLFGMVGSAALLFLGRTGSLEARDWLTAAALGLLSIAWLPLWPQIRFKPEERRLDLDERGLATSIGTCSHENPWSEVIRIDDGSGVIAINLANKCAYLVPSRAFSSPDERTRCLSLIREWHHAATAD